MTEEFYVPGFSIDYIPFLHWVKGQKEPEKLKAPLFYVHHAHFIDQINPKLEAAKCRPMTDTELRELFRMQEGILEQLDFDWIVATGPGAIKEVQGGGKMITSIWREKSGKIGICQVRIQSPILADHTGIYVAAVKME